MDGKTVTGDLAAGMASAPLVAPATNGDKAKPKAPPNTNKGNPLLAAFGKPIFARPEKAAKWYQDRFNANKQNATVGKVAFKLSDVGEIVATVYKERELGAKRADGKRPAQTFLRFSLPKGIKLSAAMKAHEDGWKAGILRAWQEWEKTAGPMAVESTRSGIIALGTEDIEDAE